MNGKTQRQMVMESTNGKMGIGMKESGGIASNTDKELIYLQIQIVIVEHTKMVNQMVMASINGKMDQSMWETLRMV